MMKVLYVDDEPALLKITKLFLEKTGDFQVETSLSAEEALGIIGSGMFDAVISDYQMPGMDGIAFLIELRKDYPHLPFIIFTGKGREEVVVQAFEHGADFYIQKGGDPAAQFAELGHKIVAAVKHRSTEADLFLLNRLYAVLTETNKAIIHATDKFALLDEICRIAVDIGDFRMAWAGFADEETETIIPTASDGYIEGYLDLMEISTRDVPGGRGPTGTAFRTGIHNVCNDIAADPAMKLWRDSALERGYGAVAAFPFAKGTANAGVLTLYAREPGYFNDQIVTLLREMSQDISFSLTMLDETGQRRAAARALQESEERFRNLAEKSSDLIITINNRFEVEYISPSVRTILGYEPEELEGYQPDERLLTLEAIAQIREAAGMSRAERTPREIEIEVKRKDGVKVTLSVFGVPVFEGDQIRGFQLQGRDITLRKEMENVLRENEERLRLYLDVAPVLFIVLDPDGNIVLVNRKCRDVLGYEEEELIGRNWFDCCIPERVRTEVKEVFMNCMIGRLDLAEYFENPVIIKTGAERLIAFHNVLIHDEDGAVANTISAGEDITERNIAAEMLRQSEEKFRTIFNTAPNLIISLNPEGRIADCNPRITDILGYTKQEVVGKPVATYIHPDYLTATEKTLQDVRNDGSEFSRHCRMVRKDGKVIDVSVNLNSVRDSEGMHFRTICLIDDITERKKAERLLKESEEQYRRIVETAREGIWAMDREYTTTFVNWRLAEMLGYTQEEMLGKKVTDFMFPADLGDHSAKMKYRKAGKGETYERRFRHRDGSERWMLVSATAYIDEGGEFMGSFAMITDITALKKTEAALRASEELRSGIIDHLPDPTLVIDDRGRVVAWNHAMEELSGIPASEMVGRGEYEYALPFYGERRPILIDLVFSMDSEIVKNYDFITRDGDTLVGETPVAQPKGKYAILWGRASPLYNKDGELIGAIETIRDVTERKAAEEAVRKANRQLILLQSITRHDILNQLNILEGLLVLSKDSLDDPDTIADYIGNEEKAVKTIERQITFTREYELLGVKEPAWQNLVQSVEHAAGSLRMDSIELKTSLDDFEVYADPLFDRVFYNLIDNALRYGGPGMTSVTISAHESGEVLTIVCEDDGAGISASDKEHLFERGYGRNTGLGLFFSRDILTITGISIYETGTEGKGARFEITVPSGAWRRGRDSKATSSCK